MDPVEDTNDQQAEEVDKQSSDQADDEGTGVEGDVEATEQDDDADDSDDDDATGDVMSQEQFDALKGDPAKLFKELNKAGTKKFQKLSARTAALKPFENFINAYNENPRAAAAALASKLGIKIQDDEAEVRSKQKAATVGEQIADKVKEALGPAYEDLAEPISKAIRESVSLLVDDAVKPLKEGQDQLITDSAQREAENVMKAFTEKHPDWKKHEGRMTQLTRQLPVGEGVSEAEYLEMIYTLATAPGLKGDAAKKAAKRMNEAAKKSSNDRTVPDSAVSKSPAGKNPTFGEAAAAAARGEVFE